MLKWLKRRVRDTFGFSKTETNAFLILIPFMGLCLFAPALYTKLFSKKYEDSDSDQQMLDSLVAQWNENLIKPVGVGEVEIKNQISIKLEDFNPNSADRALLTSVGIPVFLVQRILNYRSKNGVFRVKSDLARIYDFPDSLYRRLEPYIELPKTIELRKGRVAEESKLAEVDSDSVSIHGEEKDVALNIFDINEADTTRFKSLRGIGSTYSRRIVGYRSLLGGFVNVEQLSEVYGISDSLRATFENQLRVDESYQPRKIEINLATYKQLTAHPYINAGLARDILNAKSKYGKFKSTDDLLRIASLSESDIQKLAPYLKF